MVDARELLMMVEARRTHKKHIISRVFTILYHVPFDESLARQPVITKPTGSNLKLRVVLTSREYFIYMRSKEEQLP